MKHWNPYLEEFEKLVASSPKYPDGEFRAMARICDFAVQKEMRRKFAYAIPNDEAIDVLVENSPLVEIGVGSGYWARIAQQAGADIVCYDRGKRTGDPDWTFYHYWCHVRRGGQAKILAHTDRTLFLCWPPYDTPLAEGCLKMYGGSRFIFVGELNGCTGGGKFWRMIEKSWREARLVRIPQWPYIHDVLVVYERRQTG